MLGGTGQAIGGLGKAGFQKLFGQSGIDTGTEMMEGFTPGLLNSPEAMEMYKKQFGGLLGKVTAPVAPIMNMPQVQQMMPVIGQQLQENVQSAINPNYIGQSYENPLNTQAQQAGGYQDSIFTMLNQIGR